MSGAATLVVADAVPPVAWRNGGGLTRELLAWPDARGWQVRVSVAEIARDGPFSDFPGVERWFTVLKGAGVELAFAGRAVRLTRTDAPLRFDGAAAPGCRLLDGPTQDLNLMLRGLRGGLGLVDDGVDWTPGATAAGLFTAVAGICEADGQSHAVPAYALLWFAQAPHTLRFTAGERPAAATGWWIAAGAA
jgi:environmental stress-induced protein Ves